MSYVPDFASLIAPRKPSSLETAAEYAEKASEYVRPVKELAGKAWNSETAKLAWDEVKKTEALTQTFTYSLAVVLLFDQAKRLLGWRKGPTSGFNYYIWWITWSLKMFTWSSVIASVALTLKISKSKLDNIFTPEPTPSEAAWNLVKAVQEALGLTNDTSGYLRAAFLVVAVLFGARWHWNGARAARSARWTPAKRSGESGGLVDINLADADLKQINKLVDAFNSRNDRKNRIVKSKLVGKTGKRKQVSKTELLKILEKGLEKERKAHESGQMRVCSKR